MQPMSKRTREDQLTIDQSPEKNKSLGRLIKAFVNVDHSNGIDDGFLSMLEESEPVEFAGNSAKNSKFKPSGDVKMQEESKIKGEEK